MQESIRARDYADIEVLHKNQRFALLVYTWCALAVGMALAVGPLVGGALGHPVDLALYQETTKFAIGSVISGALTAVGHCFRRHRQG